MPSVKKLKAIDIFCGAGGFSEGFRQAGIDVIMGVDKWGPAVITHQANHPTSKTLLGYVESISVLPDDEFEKLIPDSEIIIGSPPCVAFSNSNRSGKGDKDEGKKLIKAYLRIVARKKWKQGSILKYWILENVPNSEKFIKDKYIAEDLGLEGQNILTVKNNTSNIYDAVYSGVPSRRKRYFCGDFPEPKFVIEDKTDIKLLRDVLNKLGKPNEKSEIPISDPVYEFAMPGNEVTDHHYVQRVAQYQWKKAKQLKQDKGYMGRMAFPEDLDRPARTIMATMTFSARESMIFDNGNSTYRAPTIREVASLMSFPIDYRFYGDSIGLKYKLVGNAVPPKLAFAFAKAIAEHENLEYPNDYIPRKFCDSNYFYNLNGETIPTSREKKKHPKSRYKYHIPYLIINQYRVELTNHHSSFDKLDFRWDAEIHHSQGPKAKHFNPVPVASWIPKDIQDVMNNLIEINKKRFKGFKELQSTYCLTKAQRKKADLIGPDELLGNINAFIDKYISHKYEKDIISIEEEPYSLPLLIAVGYYILSSILNEPGGLDYG